MIIRPFQTDDLPGILDIYNEAILNTTAVYEYEPFTETYIKKWWAEKFEKGFPVLIAEVDGIVAGFSTYGTFRSRVAYNSTAEHSVYVHENYRGQGIGKALLESIIEEARRNSIHVLIGGIDSSNTASMEMHLKYGFLQVAFMPEVAWKFDRWLDLIFVHKVL